MHVAAVTALATAASIPEPTSPPDPAVAELLIRQANHGGTPPAGALTTVFTPPPGCFPVSTNPLEDLDLFWTSTTTCGPPNYRSYFLPFYYSPAICPSGFTIGCTRSDSDQGPPVEPTETAMMCVLSGYSCVSFLTYYATNSALRNIQLMIQIRWASSDLSILETHPLTPGLRLAGATTTPSGPGPTDRDDTDNDDSGGGGLSSGAQIGIGVSVGVVGLALLFGGIFWFIMHRDSRAKANGAGAVGKINSATPSSMATYQGPSPAPMAGPQQPWPAPPMPTGMFTGQQPQQMQQMPPSMQPMPPNMQPMPPNIQQIPLNMQQMPPNMQQMPPNMQQMSPNMPLNPQQMPPNVQPQPMQPQQFPGYVAYMDPQTGQVAYYPQQGVPLQQQPGAPYPVAAGMPQTPGSRLSYQPPFDPNQQQVQQQQQQQQHQQQEQGQGLQQQQEQQPGLPVPTPSPDPQQQLQKAADATGTGSVSPVATSTSPATAPTPPAGGAVEMPAVPSVATKEGNSDPVEMG